MKNKSILVVTFVALGLGVKAQVSEQTSPFKATLAINPLATYTRQHYVHLVFGITF